MQAAIRQAYEASQAPLRPLLDPDPDQTTEMSLFGGDLDTTSQGLTNAPSAAPSIETSALVSPRRRWSLFMGLAAAALGMVIAVGAGVRRGLVASDTSSALPAEQSSPVAAGSPVDVSPFALDDPNAAQRADVPRPRRRAPLPTIPAEGSGSRGSPAPSSSVTVSHVRASPRRADPASSSAPTPCPVRTRFPGMPPAAVAPPRKRARGCSIGGIKKQCAAR